LELADKERLLLVERKDELRKLSEEIIELTNDIEANKITIKKNIQGVLSLVSTLASYTNSKLDIQAFVGMVTCINHFLDMDMCLEKSLKTMLGIFCSTANTITFSFSKKGLVINVPKIDLTLFKG
jgi:hypothetical protein